MYVCTVLHIHEPFLHAKTGWVIVHRIASEDSIDLRSAYVTRFSMRIIIDNLRNGLETQAEVYATSVIRFTRNPVTSL